MIIGLSHYLILSALLFSVGVVGIFLSRRHVITILMSLELMLLAVNINFVAFSAYHGDVLGQIWTLFILTVAAAEVAIGLAILVIYFRNKHDIEVDDMNLLGENKIDAYEDSQKEKAL